MPLPFIEKQQTLQQRITDLHGAETIRLAREKLCSHCTKGKPNGTCTEHILPICLNGDICPYFNER